MILSLASATGNFFEREFTTEAHRNTKDSLDEQRGWNPKKIGWIIIGKMNATDDIDH